MTTQTVEPKRCCAHDSDCAVHNMPAYPAGPCDCSLNVEQVAMKLLPPFPSEADRREAAAMLRSLAAESEQLRVQLAGCGVAALANTEACKADRAKQGSYGYSESYLEVCRAVDREITLREAVEKQAAEIERLRGLLGCIEDNLNKSMSKSMQKLQARTIREELA